MCKVILYMYQVLYYSKQCFSIKAGLFNAVQWSFGLFDRLSSIDTKYHIWKMGVVFTDNVSLQRTLYILCSPTALAALSLIVMFLVFLVFPVPGVVHHHVHTGTLQQFLFCRSLTRHCHGLQDPADHPLLSHPQRQTGYNISEALIWEMLDLGLFWYTLCFSPISIAGADRGSAGCSGVSIHRGGLQLLPEVLQQEWGRGWAGHEVWWYDDCKLQIFELFSRSRAEICTTKRSKR